MEKKIRSEMIALESEELELLVDILLQYCRRGVFRNCEISYEMKRGERKPGQHLVANVITMEK